LCTTVVDPFKEAFGSFHYIRASSIGNIVVIQSDEQLEVANQLSCL
jgi:hypothetical protein